MYSINGTLYEGTGMSGYKVRNGITIYVRFTLSYGKDIGGYDSTGGGYGSLSSYCGLWINGSYQARATTSWRRTVWNPPKQRMVTSTIAAPSAMRRKQIFSRPPAVRSHPPTAAQAAPALLLRRGSGLTPYQNKFHRTWEAAA